MNLQTLARALGGEVTGGQVLAPGPGHSTTDRSLAVKLDGSAPDGFLTYSHSGDDPIVCRDYVRAKAGLPAFKPNGHGRHRVSNDAVERAVMAAAEALGQNQDDDRPRGRVVATYDYTDAAGSLLYQVQRLEPKNFRQRRPDGNGGFIWSLGDVRRVLYRWPELQKYPDATVFVTEGEKDADRVASLGHCATCVAGSRWTEDCIKALAGRDVLILQDNDDAGRAKALAAAQALHGTAKSMRIVLLPDLPQKGDVSDWLDADPRRAEKLTEICFDVPLWTSDDNASSPPSKQQEPAADTIAPLPLINIATWHNAAVPERQWVVRDRVPLAAVTLLSGDGGVGKSIVALQLAVATATGRDWLGSLPEPGPVFVICCEDDAEELHRRTAPIAELCDTNFEQLSKAMHLLSFAGNDAVMAAPNNNGLIVPTTLLKRVTKTACEIRPRLIVLDNLADIFAGNENDRAQVRQFITLLRGIAIAANAGLLLTSHPSLTGISTGTGLSGSTAWNASVRSRLYFKRAVTEKDEEPDPDLRVLEVMKANYGPIGEVITVRWKGGLFLPVAGVGNLEKLAAEQKADQLFLTLLDRFEQQGRGVSDKRSANAYAPTMFAADPEAKAGGIRKDDFGAAMNRLFAAGKIRNERYGPPHRGWSKLVRK